MKHLNVVQPTVRHLSSDELARRWGLHKVTLRNWRVQGKGPRHMKIGKKVLYSLPVVEAYEREHMQRSTAG